MEIDEHKDLQNISRETAKIITARSTHMLILDAIEVLKKVIKENKNRGIINVI